MNPLWRGNAFNGIPKVTEWQLQIKSFYCEVLVLDECMPSNETLSIEILPSFEGTSLNLGAKSATRLTADASYFGNLSHI